MSAAAASLKLAGIILRVGREQLPQFPQQFTRPVRDKETGGGLALTGDHALAHLGPPWLIGMVRPDDFHTLVILRERGKQCRRVAFSGGRPGREPGQ